jgi:hypothetical protein
MNSHGMLKLMKQHVNTIKKEVANGASEKEKQKRRP